MRAQYKLRARTQYKQWNGYGDVWKYGNDEPTIVTVEGDDFEDAKNNARAMLLKLNSDWRYSFDTLEVIQIPDLTPLVSKGVLHS